MRRLSTLRALVPFTSLALAACSSAEPSPVAPEGQPAVASAPSPAPSAPAASSAGSTSVQTSEGDAVAAAASGPAQPAAPAAEVVPLPKGMKVLVIGDSFAQALGVGLKSKEAETGVKFVNRGEKATYIPEWAGPNRGVAGMMLQEKPDLVVVALGGNELAMVNPDVRGPKVKQLVGLFGNTPCVWVSPPLWGNKDNGLLDVIRKSSTPCRYFDSNVHSPDLPRGSDKIHPTSEGQKKWAGSFVDWLQKERAGTEKPFALKARPATE